MADHEKRIAEMYREAAKKQAEEARDTVRVVRCRDCVHYDKGENDSESWMYCKVLAKDVYDDFYCKLGKRWEVRDG